MNEQNTNLGQSPVGPTPVSPNNSEQNNLTQSQTVQEQSVQSQPVQSQPVQEQPVQSQPVQSQPVQSQPVQEQPVQSQPVQSSSEQSTEASQDIIVSATPLNPLNQETPSNLQQNATVNTSPEVNNTPPVQSPTQESIPPVTPVSQPSPGTFGPSQPINPNNNVSNVGFVASTEPVKKKKNKGLIIAIVVVLIVGLAALGYFVVYPYVVKTYLNKPINVYNSTIEQAFKGINNSVNDIVHDRVTFNIQAELESNIEDLKSFSGYKVGLDLGIDSKAKSLQLGYSIKDPSTNIEYSKNTYIKDNKEYARYSTYRDLIYLGEANLDEANELFSSFEELFDKAEAINSNDLSYLINKLSELIKGSIDENKLSKEDASITLNDEKLKVVNNRYEIDYENYLRTEKYILDGLIKDDKVLEILAKMQESTSDEVKADLEEDLKAIEDNKEDNQDGKIFINIYTYGLNNKIIGYSITSDKDESELHYYNKDGYFELVADMKFSSSDDETLSLNLDDIKISLVGKKDGDNTKVSLTVADKEIANFTVREWNENKIDLDYSIKIESDEITGTFVYSKDKNNDRLKIDLEASLKVEKESVKVKVSITDDWTSEVSNINTKEAVTLSDEEINSIEQEFNNILSKTTLGELFTTVSGDYDTDISTYYSGQYNGIGYDENENYIDDNTMGDTNTVEGTINGTSSDNMNV